MKKMKKWILKEVSDAKDFKGKRTPRSGGIWSRPGDIKTKDLLIDSKATDAKSFSVTVKMWKKINKEALLSCRLPVLSIKFNKSGEELVVISKTDFLHYLKRD